MRVRDARPTTSKQWGQIRGVLAVRAPLGFFLATVAVVVIAACGSSSSSGDPVARVGEHAIGKAELSHWMTVAVDGDVYELTRRVAPAGVVSEPANNAACVAALARATAPWDAEASKPRLGAAQLRSGCEQLERAIRRQALETLVSRQQLIALAAEQGVTAPAAEVQRRFASESARRGAAARSYLADRHLTVADDLRVIEGELLSNKLRQKLSSEGAAFIARVEQAEKSWKSKTTCSAGYVVEGCKQYSAADKPTGRSASTLIEELIPSRPLGTAVDINCSHGRCSPVGKEHRKTP